VLASSFRQLQRPQALEVPSAIPANGQQQDTMSTWYVMNKHKTSVDEQCQIDSRRNGQVQQLTL
jgi:hypothetical protein